MRRITLFALAFIVVAATAFGQTATVTKNVNLRPDPSTGQAAITLLTPGTSLTLLEATPTSGYYHVRTPDGQEGWVYGRNIRIAPQPTAPPPPPAATGCPPTGTHVVNGKPVPYAANSDAGLRNTAKKHIPTGTTPVPLTFDDFKALQDDTNQLFRDAHATKAKIEPNRDALHNLQTTSRTVNEGDLVQLMGFIVADTKQGAESVNCGGSDGFDFHINIGDRKSVV